MITRVFVYGTLKRGECREACWPSGPLSISTAWVHGILYDLGPFPAMLRGADLVEGEVWEFEPDQMPEVLRTLDAIEGTDQPGEPNEYDRTVVQAHRQDGEVDAYTYIFANPEKLREARRIEPQESGGKSVVVWHSIDSGKVK